MTVIIIFFLLLIGWSLALLKYRIACKCLFAFITVILLSIGSGLAPSLLLNNLQKPFKKITIPLWQQNNAIILLGGGLVKSPSAHEIRPSERGYSRIFTAAQLYQACIKKSNCTIIVSGGDPQHLGWTEAVVYKNALVKLGVKDADVITETHSRNTFQNAEMTSHLLQQKHYDLILLTTSAIHLKRALLLYSFFNIRPDPIPADFTLFKPVSLTGNFIACDLALNEYLKALVAPYFRK
ncbi:MAG: YdcF family protein [Proteobacteria bacterium]|nr:YdcF family protein [Pseudomonadota bacterium]